MKNYFLKILLPLSIFILTGLFMLSCSQNSSSKVTIYINLGIENKNSLNTYHNSIFDKILRFFEKDIEAQTAYIPSINLLVLNISGEGMDSIHRSYSNVIPTSITVEIPAGKSRLFEILAYTSSVTLRGAETMNLSGEESVYLPIRMRLYETKIIVPDYKNYRISQIDDMNGTNYTYNSSFTGFTGNFRPYDIDFDNQGRIYIANSGFASGDGVIIRINDISSSTCTLLTASSGAGLYNRNSIAIDRKNNYLYYANNGQNRIYRYDITTGDDTVYYNNPTIEGYIDGLAINDGYIYIISGSDFKYVSKYNIQTQTTEKIITNRASLTSYYVSWLNNPFDVIVKSGHVYITDIDNAMVIQLNSNLEFEASLSSSPNASYSFWGPHRFAAVLNKKIYVTDDNGEAQARIDSFDDISGNNWETYGTWSQFRFWCSC